MTSTSLWLELAWILEIALLVLMVILEKRSLDIERANHLLYRDFFNARTRWYASRTPKRPLPAEPPADIPTPLAVIRAESELVQDGSGEADSVGGTL